jgi:hypothetical protein
VPTPTPPFATCATCLPQNTASLCPAAPYSTVCYTPKGLAWYSEWGTLRNTNNAVFLATLMGKHGASAASRQQHVCWARRCVLLAVAVGLGAVAASESAQRMTDLLLCLRPARLLIRTTPARQMRYTLGSSGSSRSYVIGYGPSQPQRPHHRQSACAPKYSAPCTASNGGTCCAGENSACSFVFCFLGFVVDDDC